MKTLKQFVVGAIYLIATYSSAFASTRVMIDTVASAHEAVDICISVQFDSPETHLSSLNVSGASLVSNDIWRVETIVDPTRISVSVMGCDDEGMCFMPESFEFVFDKMSGRFVLADGNQPADMKDRPEDDADFRIVKSRAGYMNADAFLSFLDEVEGKSDDTGFFSNPAKFLADNGIWVTLLLVLFGGIMLNLTPCVLPMMPINLAIIGAGAGSSKRGFSLGAAYGFGIILVYGGLGWLVLRFGLFFGALQASPWFNSAIALIFAVLGLALLDVFIIDFGRLSSSGGSGPAKTGFRAALLAGAFSALLAGACVAPVVIAVLLLGGTLVASGYHAAQLLPFVLGLGMALPWPFAGAGLSFLPKPGKWMVHVKQVFAVFVFILAAYYAYVAVEGFMYKFRSHEDGRDTSVGIVSAEDPAALNARISKARDIGKPVLVDVWATWCKNCSAMDATTFRDKRVVERLALYEVIKLQAENPDNLETRKLLDKLGVRGLPSFIVLDQ